MKKIMVVAVGGAGCNIAKAIKQKTSSKLLQDASFVFLDSDEEHLTKFEGDNNLAIVLKKTPDVIPSGLFDNVGSLVIVAGLGGNTTEKFLPAIIRKASSASVPDISVFATTPFYFEGENRIAAAIKTASVVQRSGGIEINLLNNEYTVNRFPELNLIDAQELADNEMMRRIEATLGQ